jgi:hypothetical protein
VCRPRSISASAIRFVSMASSEEDMLETLHDRLPDRVSELFHTATTPHTKENCASMNWENDNSPGSSPTSVIDCSTPARTLLSRVSRQG